jgi:hypothetical protein
VLNYGAVDEKQANFEPGLLQESDADTRLAARLKQLLQTPGISDKDRKLVQRNLKRLVEAASLR